jgi:hypothetical protein
MLPLVTLHSVIITRTLMVWSQLDLSQQALWSFLHSVVVVTTHFNTVNAITLLVQDTSPYAVLTPTPVELAQATAKFSHPVLVVCNFFYKIFIKYYKDFYKSLFLDKFFCKK